MHPRFVIDKTYVCRRTGWTMKSFADAEGYAGWSLDDLSLWLSGLFASRSLSKYIPASRTAMSVGSTRAIRESHLPNPMA